MDIAELADQWISEGLFDEEIRHCTDILNAQPNPEAQGIETTPDEIQRAFLCRLQTCILRCSRDKPAAFEVVKEYLQTTLSDETTARESLWRLIDDIARKSPSEAAEELFRVTGNELWQRGKDV